MPILPQPLGLTPTQAYPRPAWHVRTIAVQVDYKEALLGAQSEPVLVW